MCAVTPHKRAFAETLRPIVEDILQEGAVTVQAVARELDRRGSRPRRAALWSNWSARAVLVRLGLPVSPLRPYRPRRAKVDREAAWFARLDDATVWQRAMEAVGTAPGAAEHPARYVKPGRARGALRGSLGRLRRGGR